MAPGIWRPVPNHGGPMSAHLGLVLHVQEGNGSPYGEFSNPASLASYHWWVSKTGTIEWYVDPADESWAQIAGNSTYLSVGTEGFTTEPLTPPQLTGVSQIYTWAAETYGFGYELAEVPGQQGSGWHGMGCNYNWGHCECPGTIRIGQRQAILDEAQGVEMNATQAAQLAAVFTFITEESDKVGAGLPWDVTAILNDIRVMQADIALIKAKVGA